jgi:muramoyltetrapeptide carboxypeptidase
MRSIKPKKLQKGDLIGIISPASSVDDPLKIEKGVNYLESLGYKVILGKNVGKYNGYLAGNDEERADDLHSMFENKNVRAVFCLRGGYGASRLLDKIDYKIIRNHPKIFVGYSDISALHLSIFYKTGLITFAGPMVGVDFYEEVSSFTAEMFWKLLTSSKKFGKIENPGDENILQLNSGSTSGKIVGGNLSVITGLIGTNYFPDLKDKILFIEEIGELPYKIDRMFNQFRLSSMFKGLKGVIIGSFSDCQEPDPEKRTLTLGEVISDYFSSMKLPVVYNFRHGHLKDNITVPVGANVKLNASRGYVEITEAVVS